MTAPATTPEPVRCKHDASFAPSQIPCGNRAKTRLTVTGAGLFDLDDAPTCARCGRVYRALIAKYYPTATVESRPL